MFIQEREDKEKQAQQLKRSRITKLASVFSRTNSVLTGRRITVNVVDEPSQKSPAWSSTNEMWLNLAELSDDITAETILSLQGLDFHELGHLRYTPRNGSHLATWVRENKLWTAFNCLEDSRIETLMVGYLPSITNWLVATVTEFLLSDEEAIATAFPLVTGRRYLPTELQQLAVDNYKRPQDIQAIYDIVDEYRTLLFVGEPSEVNQATDRAKVLIQQFHDLLELLPPMTSNGDGEGVTVVVRIKNPNGHDNRPTQGVESSSVRPVNRKQQEQDLGKSATKDKPKPVLVVDVELENDEATDDGNAGDEGTDGVGDTSKEDVSEVKTPQSPKSPSTSPSDDDDEEFEFDDEEFDDSEFDEPSSTPSKSKQAGNEAGTTGDNQQVTQVLESVMNDVLEQLSKEINQIAKQMGVDVGLDGGNTETPKSARYKEVSANPELVLTSKAFGRELERLRAKYDPSWETEVDIGRLNVNRYLSGEDFDTCFDEWQEGRADVTAIEAVILLDKSGSMAGRNADMAYQSMWAIKKALETVEAKTTVCLFDSYTTLLYGADEKAGNTIRDGGASGGTNPENAILYAKRVLAESQKPIKVLFMITDGLWEAKVGEEAVAEMRNAGVLTCQAFLEESNVSANYLEPYRHSFELLTHIKSAKDIVILGKELVRLAISRNLVSNS